ncbi:sel1 repeat family protein [Nitrosomonas sp. HPC101]|uniref:tetratricopeptide repeat protein n=1 Tax=Nitrosomonas sp. HPC101 TaxID=1658667 RepID=UPI00136B41D2|nr:tetratricopeptide repeat protein [Nitrosomonas sp. HPC101]MXS84835.1 sel1 repeat family protein [Nitrosomonas sp. HPC101]
MKTITILLAATLLVAGCGNKSSTEKTAVGESEIALMGESTSAGELPSFLKEGLSEKEQDELKKKIMPTLDDGLTSEQRFLNLRKAAEAGDAEAQNGLGSMYFSGEAVSHDARGNPLDKDPEAAAGWFYRAAEQGHADAQFNLGLLYFTGEGVAQDKTKAVELFTQSAEQGNIDAQNNLGVIYLLGEGVEQNTDKAVEWFKKAAEQGNEDAIQNLKAIRATQKDSGK